MTKIEALDERGVEFVFLTEVVDITTAQGRLALHRLRALAEFEREIAGERPVRPRALSGGGSATGPGAHEDPDVSTAQICERFDSSKATLYRYVGPGGEQQK